MGGGWVIELDIESFFDTLDKGKLRAMLHQRVRDAVLCFSNERDAARVMEALPQRLGRYGLRLHPVKTSMVHFKPPRHLADPRGNRSFNLLCFTHYWGKSRRGRWVIQRTTAKDRFRRSLRAFALWCHAMKVGSSISSAAEMYSAWASTVARCSAGSKGWVFVRMFHLTGWGQVCGLR